MAQENDFEEDFELDFEMDFADVPDVDATDWAEFWADWHIYPDCKTDTKGADTRQ